MSQTNSNFKDQMGTPWYRFGMVWMIIALPAIVVVASLITVSIAFNSAPIVIEKGHYESAVSDTTE